MCWRVAEALRIKAQVMRGIYKVDVVAAGMKSCLYTRKIIQ